MGEIALTADDVPNLISDDFRNPANAPFQLMYRHLQEQMMDMTAKMKPWQVECVKMKRNLVPHNQMSKRLDVPTLAIDRFFKYDPKGMGLLTLMQNLESLENGPTRSARRNMLHTIAVMCEKLDPKVSIAAIAEQNRMDDSDRKVTEMAGGPTKIEININQEALPRTVLDG